MSPPVLWVRRVRAALLEYYRACARDLPWRRRHDPYGIWLSEVMLQQTQVETVRHRYEQFLALYPDLESLAGVDETRVCEAWAGLGYYRRARNLHRAARLLVREHGGVWPTTATGLALLPGIGHYTAAAVAAIAFAEPVAAVDGNLMRVFARLLMEPGSAKDQGLRRRVEEVATMVVSPAPGDLNQALMDLGATLCTPTAPRCPACPVRPYCAAAASGEPERFPAPARRVPRTKLAIAFAWVEDAAGVRLRQRSLDGLWAGLWELPSASGSSAKAALAREFGPLVAKPLVQVEHELSHRHVQARVFAVKSVPADVHDLTIFREPLEAALSALARKAIVAVGNARRS